MTTDIPPLDGPSIAALLGWAGQHDGRISLEDGINGKPGPGDVNYAKWEAGLQHVRATVDQAAAVITDYYANTPADGDKLPPITPYMLRQRLGAAKEGAAAHRSALSAGQLEPPKRPKGSWRQRNPDEWDRLVAEGKQARRDDLARRGIPLQQWQIDNQPNPAGRAL